MKNLKKLFPCLLIIVVLFSCVNDRKDKTDIHTNKEPESETEDIKPLEISAMPWHSNLDTVTQVFSLKRNEDIKTQDLDSANVLKSINKNYPQNPLVWDHKSGDTAYVNIPNATYLTQQSGSLGAKLFLAESTYSITEIPGINVVNFNFQVGDHATPGAYKREDFNFSMP